MESVHVLQAGGHSSRMARGTVFTLALLALLSSIPGSLQDRGGLGLLQLQRVRRSPPSREEDRGPGPSSRQSACSLCSERLRHLVRPTDWLRMQDEAWVREKCREGEADYQCLMSEACLKDPLVDETEAPVHENFCSNVEGVVALAHCWEDPGFPAISESCQDATAEDLEFQSDADDDFYENYNCRSIRRNGECLVSKAQACPSSAQAVVTGEMDIFIRDSCS